MISTAEKFSKMGQRLDEMAMEWEFPEGFEIELEEEVPEEVEQLELEHEAEEQAWYLEGTTRVTWEYLDADGKLVKIDEGEKPFLVLEKPDPEMGWTAEKIKLW